MLHYFALYFILLKALYEIFQIRSCPLEAVSLHDSFFLNRTLGIPFVSGFLWHFVLFCLGLDWFGLAFFPGVERTSAVVMFSATVVVWNVSVHF